MKDIVVVSDNHGNKEVLNDIIKANPNACLYIHCGDSEMLPYELSPFISVKGNNDYYLDNIFALAEYETFHAYVTHGNRMFLSKANMAAKAKEYHCNFFIHGHTHVPYLENYEGITLLCPGSLAYPRSFKGTTYALIHIMNDGTFEVEFKKY